MYKINTKMTGNKIKKQMRRADMETTDIAKMLGYADRSTINRWIRGESVPSYENLVNMAIAFKCRVKDLVAFEEENGSKEWQDS